MRFLQGAVGFDLMQRAHGNTTIAGQTITIAGTDFLTLDMGQVVLGDIVMCSYDCQGLKGVTGGLNALNLRIGAPSTADIEWFGPFDAFADFWQVNANDNIRCARSAIGRVIAPGTCHLFLNATSLGSNTTGATFSFQAWVLRGS